MAHQNDAPGRDVETSSAGASRRRSPSASAPTRAHAQLLPPEDDNIPQYGVPYFSAFGGPLPGVDPSNYFGYHNVDTQDIDVDMLTGVFEHDFSDAMTLRSLARFQQVDQLSIVDAPQGTWCLAAASTPPPARLARAARLPGTGLISRTRPARQRARHPQRDRDQPDRPDLALQHRLDRARAGGRRVALAAKTSTSTPAACCATPTAPPCQLPLMSIADPDSLYTGPVNFILTGRTAGRARQPGDLRVRHARVQRAVDAEPRRALRAQRRRQCDLEHQDLHGADRGQPATRQQQHRRRPQPRPGGENDDDLFSYRAGAGLQAGRERQHLPVVRQLQDAVEGFGQRLLHCLGHDRAPTTATSIRKPRSTTSSAPSGTSTDSLALTAAVFRNERKNYNVADPGNPANPSGEQQLDGEARVDGIIARRRPAGSPTTGRSSPTHLSRQRSAAGRVRRLPRQSASGLRQHRSGPDPLKGMPISATPERSGSLWTTYDLNAVDRSATAYLPERLRVLHQQRDEPAQQPRRHQGLHHAPRDGRL